jgi:3-dehydroquinate synthase
MHITVSLAERSYPIYIETELFDELGFMIGAHHPASSYAIITDSTVGKLYGSRVRALLADAGCTVTYHEFEAGEASKNPATVAALCSELARAGHDRTSVVIALGGGVAGDIGGFVASIYLRGITCLQIPTTLLAQVDSSVGGKTGVDLPEGKNLVGTFSQPSAVFIDPDVLHTLPDDQFIAGLAEVIKYGVIRDPEFLVYLDVYREPILARRPDALIHVIKTCCLIKAAVVAEDEKEGDIRRILNFGHTIGHAVEAASDFTILHGNAVAIGMVAAARLAVRHKVLSEERAQYLQALIARYGLPTEIPAELDLGRITSYLGTDKKRVGTSLFFILPTDEGSVLITDEVEPRHIDAVLSAD